VPLRYRGGGVWSYRPADPVGTPTVSVARSVTANGINEPQTFPFPLWFERGELESLTLSVLDEQVAIIGGDEGSLELRGYQSRWVLDGRYEVVSGTASVGEEDVDVIAVSDPAPLLLGGIVLGVCAVVHAADLWFLHHELEASRAAGNVVRWRLRCHPAARERSSALEIRGCPDRRLLRLPLGRYPFVGS
jgi:hypothetical protein